jgi:hypothetical protein
MNRWFTKNIQRKKKQFNTATPKPDGFGVMAA